MTKITIILFNHYIIQLLSFMTIQPLIIQFLNRRYRFMLKL